MVFFSEPLFWGARMLFFNIGKQKITGEKVECAKTCSCGSQKFWLATVLHYVQVGPFALFPFKKDKKLVCRNCFKANDGHFCEELEFPKVKPSQYLAKMTGWPAMFALAFALNHFYYSIYPQDEALRQHPRIGDVYFVNYHKMTGDITQSSHPYRIAKVIGFDEGSQQLKVKMSGWSYGDEMSLFKEYVVRKDNLNSYFSHTEKLISKMQLNDNSLVLSARRRVSSDIETLSLKTEYYREPLIYPSS